MRYLFYMGHPAHYHNISVVCKNLKEKGHAIQLVARNKDVLVDLVKDLDYPIEYLRPRKGNSKLALIKAVLEREKKLYYLVKDFIPDVLIGTDIAITHIGRLLQVPSIILNEDDPHLIPLFTTFGIKYATTVLSPVSVNLGKYAHKTIKYPGYHELAYLHPNHFKPKRANIVHLFDDKERYFLIRFSSLEAHHDRGIKGINKELTQQILQVLSPHGKVYITSERPLPPDLEPFRIQIAPADMHHALFFADLFIGDSQTMAAEAAVLGTPAIRFNDFVGKVGYLNELENKYGLAYGITPGNPDKLLELLHSLLRMYNLKEMWYQKRELMLMQNIDVARFWTWFFELYPQSIVSSQDYIQQLVAKAN